MIMRSGQQLLLPASPWFIAGSLLVALLLSMLGQHALSYTALSFLAIMIHRRVLWFPVPSQALQILPLLLAAHVLDMLVRLASGAGFPVWSYWLAPFLQALLWPVASVVLLMPQRRAPDPDATRPL